MNLDGFIVASLTQIENATGIDRHRWSRYINGKVAMNERTLNKAAKAIGAKPVDLLAAIQERRRVKGVVSKSNMPQA